MKQSFYIGLIVALQLIFMLGTQLLIVRISGIGAMTDSYIAAQTIPSIVISIVVSALQSVWLPRLSVTSSDNSIWQLEQSKALGQAGLVGGVIFLLISISMFYWLPLLYPGFSERQLQSTIYFSYVLLAASVFNIQSALLTVSLRSKGLFITAESLTLLGTALSLIAIFYALPIWGLLSAAWITLARSILVYLLQLKLAGWPSISLVNGWKCKETWRLMRPLLWGTSIYKMSPLVDRYWASQAPTGSITIFNLAQMGIIALATILERTISVTVTPSFSQYAKDNNYIGLRDTYRKSLRRVSELVVLIGIVLFLTKPIFLLIFSKLLNLESDIVENIWFLSMLFLGFLHAVASGGLLVAVFYALNDTKTPVFIGIGGFIFGLIIKFFAFEQFGLNGLVSAASIYLLVNIILYLYFLDRKIKLNMRK